MRIRLEWEPRDCWIGAFWRTQALAARRNGLHLGDGTPLCDVTKQRDIWICLVPMVPIHITLGPFIVNERERA